jgi:D-aminopeptidase
VAEGCVGAGTGTVAFGWKGGTGTSSRRLPAALGNYIVGVLVQSNYGGVLQIAGQPIGQQLGQYYLREQLAATPPAECADGSIMIIVATDAPLSDRNLTRLAQRALAGLARTGAAMSNGSGDYVIAFSTAMEVRRTPLPTDAPTIPLRATLEVPNDQLSPLFQAVIEATEEAIYNSLCMANTMRGHRGHTVQALPLSAIRRQL